MKQLIFIFILLLGGYYIYNSGFIDVLKNTNIDPAGFVEEVKSATASTVASVVKKERFPKLPLRAETRAGGLQGANNSYRAVDETVFNTYDVGTSYGWVDIVYSSGSENSKKVIDKYLSQFSLPEDRNLILELVSKYKDRESLDILADFINRGTFARRTVFRKIAAFEHPEILPLIENFMKSDNTTIQKEAARAHGEIIETRWFSDYKTGLEEGAEHSSEGKKQLPRGAIDAAFSGNI